MKLSELVPEGVPSASGYEQAASSTLGLGEKQAHAWQTGAQVAGEVVQQDLDIINTITKVQTETADANIKVRETQTKNMLAQKKNYTWEEAATLMGGEENIPPAVAAQFPKDSGQQIPAFAIQGQYFAQQRKKIVDEESSKIAVQGKRDEYKIRANAEADFDISNTQEALAKERDAWAIANTIFNVHKYTAVGDFKGANKAIDDSDKLDAVQKIKAHEDVLHRQGEWAGDSPLRTQDMALINSSIAGFESGSSTFTVKDGVGKETTADITGLSNDERREALAHLRQYKDHLERAGKDDDKHKYDVPDDAVRNRLAQIYVNGGRLSDLTRLVTDVFKANVNSPKMKDHVLGLLRERQNLSFTRTETYGSPPGVVAWSKAMQALATGQPFTMSDGQEYDPKTMDLDKFRQDNGIKPDRLPGMITAQKQLNQNKAPDISGRERSIKLNLEAQEAGGNAVNQAEKESTQSQLHLAVVDLIDQENKQRAIAKQAPMNRKEEDDFIDHFFKREARQVNKGKGIFGGQKSDATDGITGMDAKEVRDWVKLRGEILNAHEPAPFSTEGPDMAAFIVGAEQLRPSFEKNEWGGRNNPQAVRRYLANIQVDRPRLEAKLKHGGIFDPTPDQVVQEWLYERKKTRRSPIADLPTDTTEYDLRTKP